MAARLRAVSKFAQFLFWCTLLIPVQALILLFSKGKAAYILPAFFHGAFCRIFGIEIEVRGKPCAGGQVLYAGNHLSYLDIPVISAVMPVSFLAKAEVASWPFFGLLARLQQTAFINRARTASLRENEALKERLRDGKSLVIFPEGTSSDGSAVLPFKSSLFAIPLGIAPVTIQPFTLELAAVDGRPATTEKVRDLYAWHGDMTLIPHFWNFGKSRGAKVRLHFHQPIQVQQGDDRKALAKSCRDAVASVLPAQRQKPADLLETDKTEQEQKNEYHGSGSKKS